MNSSPLVVVGGGLAGCECAWQLAEQGHQVHLFEQRPTSSSPAHHSDNLAELVCSNSFRGAAITNAVGALKEEMRRCGSLVMRVADENRVPAGGALAVNRELFSGAITASIQTHPRIRVFRERLDCIPETRPCVLATGPLTADALAQDLALRLGASSLAYYDAIAPIISAESINWQVAFAQSRFDKNDSGQAEDADAYVNCPMDEPQYKQFVRALIDAEKVVPHAFEEPRYFEGCLPVEVMAERGEMTLAFGPMKPVGLTDPRTARRPYAVVQLRPEDQAKSAYNMVGFQTRMTHEAQQRVFRMIPGLEQAVFMRLGSVHRNTFVNAPQVLDETLQLRALPGVFMAGQVTGVEGYVESAACGLLCGLLLADRLADREPVPPPPTTLLGGLLGHLRSGTVPFQPSNITWAHLPPLEGRVRKNDQKTLRAQRALADLERWVQSRSR